MPDFILDAAGPTRPFSDFWRKSVGSGRAALGLRADWQAQMRRTREEIGFETVRCHDLFSTDLGIFSDHGGPGRIGEERTSFHNAFLFWDFLLSIGMKPFVELSFMPESMASTEATIFSYKAHTSPPKDHEAWSRLIAALAQAAVDRYGLDEVATWHWELWNEPNLAPGFFDGTQADYFRLYEHTARALKHVSPRLRVGGPATAANAWIGDTIDFCREHGVPLDFLSTHHYPGDIAVKHGGVYKVEDAYKRGILTKMILRVRAEMEAHGGADLPLLYTEWNPGWADEPKGAAGLVKAIGDNDGLVDAYAFWTFSDLFAEWPQRSEPFHGGFGLQTIHGVRKPVYRAYQLLAELGADRLSVRRGDAAETLDLLAVRDAGRTSGGGGGSGPLRLLLSNHAPWGDDPISTHAVRVRLENPGRLGASATVRRIQPGHADARTAWEAMGSPTYPTPAQLEALHAASELTREPLPVHRAGEAVELEVTIPPQSLAAVVLD